MPAPNALNKSTPILTLGRHDAEMKLRFGAWLLAAALPLGRLPARAAAPIVPV